VWAWRNWSIELAGVHFGPRSTSSSFGSALVQVPSVHGLRSSGRMGEQGWAGRVVRWAKPGRRELDSDRRQAGTLLWTVSVSAGGASDGEDWSLRG
jgi:hypothetical protein